MPDGNGAEFDTSTWSPSAFDSVERRLREGRIPHLFVSGTLVVDLYHQERVADIVRSVVGNTAANRFQLNAMRGTRYDTSGWTRPQAAQIRLALAARSFPYEVVGDSLVVAGDPVEIDQIVRSVAGEVQSTSTADPQSGNPAVVPPRPAPLPPPVAPVVTRKFCGFCGFESTSSGGYCPSCGIAYGSARPFVPPPQPVDTPTGRDVSPALAVLCIVSGCAGIVSTFLPWLTDGVTSVNGWDARSAADKAGLYSGGPAMVTWMSALVVLAIMGSLFRLSVSQRFTISNRWSLGVLLICFGVIQFFAVAAQYSALDDLAKQAGVVVNAGIGMAIAIFMSFVYALLGVLTLAVKSLVTPD